MTVLFLADVPDPNAWMRVLTPALAGETLRCFPDVGDPGQVDVAIIAKPPPGELAKLSNLKLICSLWAGVDGIAKDTTLPRNVPLARMVDPQMTRAMTESVLAHVLAAHRQLDTFRRQQADGVWRVLPQKWARETRVGILGLGELGIDAANKLLALDFAVAGWSRRPKTVPGVKGFAGGDQLLPFLAETDILVCLIPLTADTRGLLDARAFAALPAGATVINLARGPIIVDADLIAALDSGHLAGAVLDVFETEPLPAPHPYWKHPRVFITPHVAAFSDPRSCAEVVAANIRRLRAGQPVQNLVDWAAGY